VTRWRRKSAALIVVLAVVCAASTAWLIQSAGALSARGNQAALTGGNGFNGALWLAFLAALATVVASAIALAATVVVHFIRRG
jgi:hypothetical protein